MAFEIELNGLVFNSTNTPHAGDSVSLYTVNEQNPATFYRNTTILQNKALDNGGRVIFSGIYPGTYDIMVNHPSGVVGVYNYIVKNEFTVPEGDSSSLKESRTFVRSLETISGTGIKVAIPLIPEQHLGYPSDPYSGTYSGAGFIAQVFESPFDGTLISGTLALQKQFYNSYYSTNQSPLFVQNFTIKLPYSS